MTFVVKEVWFIPETLIAVMSEVTTFPFLSDFRMMVSVLLTHVFLV